MDVMEEQLNQFFKRVGDLHATNVLHDIPRYIPLMKRYPQITIQQIHKFEHYFSEAPANNHQAALMCLEIISKEIPSVRPQVIEKLGPILYDYLPLWKELPEYVSLKRVLEILELPLTKKDEYMRNLARSVITHKKPMILIIGAGFSYDSMPITNELQPLLVQFMREIGISSPVKMIKKNDEQVWRLVKENSGRFQDMLTGWCARSLPAHQHRIVARMLHKGYISHIISFNWDNLIERAYEDEFNKNLLKVVTEGSIPKKPSLWKLHGDVADPSMSWIFPYEEGRIFNSLIESLSQIVDQNCPQFALIVGYSEWEKIIQDRLIKWLEDNIPTVLRIHPKWKEKRSGGISENAKHFFERLDIYFEMERKSRN